MPSDQTRRLETSANLTQRVRGPGVLGTTASKQPSVGRSVEYTCGLLIRDPAVKFMHRTFNYYTHRPTLRAVAAAGPAVASC